MQNNVDYHKLNREDIPEKLQVIDSPPKQLFFRGANPNKLLTAKSVAIVGSRKPTQYGIDVTTEITDKLARYGVTIISGLALGVDTIAHSTCLKAGGKTLAVLPCGPETIYPSTHHHIARQIITNGGGILTEYDVGTPALRQNFIARNRIVSGLSDLVIVTEAAEKSGTLHTANFALNQSKTVMAVPGPINSPLSKGTNNLIKAGAIPITEPSDILFQLGVNLQKQSIPVANNQQEELIINLLREGVSNGEEMLIKSGLSAQLFNQTLTLLEINGQVKALGGNHWHLG